MDPVIQPGSNRCEALKQVCDNLARSMGWCGKDGYCRTCNCTIHGFRNELSEREFLISGMCQECQDEMFGTGVDGS